MVSILFCDVHRIVIQICHGLDMHFVGSNISFWGTKKAVEKQDFISFNSNSNLSIFIILPMFYSFKRWGKIFLVKRSGLWTQSAWGPESLRTLDLHLPILKKVFDSVKDAKQENISCQYLYFFKCINRQFFLPFTCYSSCPWGTQWTSPSWNLSSPALLWRQSVFI